MAAVAPAADVAAAAPVALNGDFSASVSALGSGEAGVSRLCVQLAQLTPPCCTAAQVARTVEQTKKQLAQLEAQVQALRAAALDDPELIQAEQNKKMHIIEQHASLIQELHGHLRTSVLQARAGLERAAIAERNELMAASDPAAAQRRQRQIQGESAATKSSAFTASLQRTRALMSAEIARSSSALGTLQQSTSVLGSTNTEYRTYSATVAVGRKMITKQLQRERTDKMLLWLGCAFFALCVAYIVNRRLAPFLFWWTHFFIHKSAAPSPSSATMAGTATGASATTTTTTTTAPSTYYAPLHTTPPVYVPSPGHPIPAEQQGRAQGQQHHHYQQQWVPPSVLPPIITQETAPVPSQQQHPPPPISSPAAAISEPVHAGHSVDPTLQQSQQPLEQRVHAHLHQQDQQQQHEQQPGVEASHQQAMPQQYGHAGMGHLHGVGARAGGLHAYDDPPLYGGHAHSHEHGHGHHQHAHEHGHAHCHAHAHDEL